MAPASVPYGTLLTALASRLGESSAVFWTVPELTIALQDAARTFNALTNYFRARGAFTAVPDQRVYDLPTVLPALRAQTVTDQDLIVDIQYALMEPPNASGWSGSDQFTLASVTAAILRRRNAFLLATGQVVTSRTMPISPVPALRTTLPSSVIDVRHADWRDADGNLWPLVRDDEWAMNAFRPSWNLDPTPIPVIYSVGVVPPTQIQIAPAPLDAGMLELLTIETGPALAPTQGPTVLGVPDDWAWVIRWGALADLLGQTGIASDVPRAQYCQQRFDDGVTLAKAASVVMGAVVDGQELQVVSLGEADQFCPAWANERGTPTLCLVAGLTCVAVSPVAWGPTGPDGVALDVVTNAPILATVPWVPIADEYLDGLLDYAQHLASFKMGGAEFLSTTSLLDRFSALCGVDLSHRRASTPDLDLLGSRTQKDEQQVVRESA